MNEYTYLKIEIIWIPGHGEIEGNEIADTEANKAATDPTKPTLQLQAVKISTSKVH